MRYKVTHITRYQYTQAAPVCHNLTHLAPRACPGQTVEHHRLLVNPAPDDRAKRIDYFGNPVDYFALHKAHKNMTVTSTSRIDVHRPAAPELPDSPPWEHVLKRTRQGRSPAALETLQFTFASPRIPLGEDVRAYAEPFFPAERPLLEACRELTAQIHRDFAYDSRATTVNTPLDVAFRNRRGVCQDFAHIQIACLRSLGLAARYVSGYLRTLPPPGKPRLVGADASHAWVSVACGDTWVDFDPTNDKLIGADHITLAYGRDYSDVCPIQGVFVGGGQHRMSVSVDVQPLDDESDG